MRRLTIVIASIATLGMSGLVFLDFVPQAAAGSGKVITAATERTASFSVENMTCEACPITVRKAMERVEGVKSVQVDFDTKTATVVFDPSVTTVEAIAAASTNVGYPATLKN